VARLLDQTSKEMVTTQPLGYKMENLKINAETTFRRSLNVVMKATEYIKWVRIQPQSRNSYIKLNYNPFYSRTHLK